MRLSDGVHGLREFLKANGLRKADVVRAIGVTHPAVIDWLKGTKTPTVEHREKIATWTSGEVPASAWEPLKKSGAKVVTVVPYRASGAA